MWAASAAADSVTGTVVAHDRVDQVVVLDDKTVLTYSNETTLPEDLKQGDTVAVEYTGSEGDMAQIISITRAGQ
jgi:hypothetical protein